jgi:Zn-dependent metalloprotease
MKDAKVAEVVISNERQTPSLILFKETQTPYKAAEAPFLLQDYLSLRTGYDNIVPIKKNDLFSDISVPEYQQYFKGVKVEYSRYKALLKHQDIAFMSGSFYEIPAAMSVTPSIQETQALAFAKKQIGAKKYAWEDLQESIATAQNDKVKQALQRELKEYLPKGELVIVKDFTKTDIVEMRLAYKFNIYAAEPLSRGYIFIDAQTGKTLLYNAIIKHASVETTVTTRYAGNRKIMVKQISGNDPNTGLPLASSHPTTEAYVPGAATHVLIDDTRGNGIETYDLNNVGGLPLSLAALYAQGKSFTDVDNNWTLPEHKRAATEGGAAEAENDDIAWDAHWGAEIVYDYWKAKHNRLSYDGKNAAIKSYVHYGPAYDNAFWNGTAMTYGDGSGNAATGFKALTSLDVCGHEIGHGICSYTSDLVYEKESGAMNEAFSDIWAACVENFAIKTIDPTLTTKYKPFFIGEQISFDAQPLRRMDAPKLTGNPDTYGGQNWSNPNCTPNLANDQCGVHNNSGVLNKWFYLLTVGSLNGSGPDASYAIPGADDGLRDDTVGGLKANTVPYSVAGLGFAISEQISFITETMLSSTATFAEAREMSIAAAKAYSGNPCGNIVQSVTNAWFAVGVGPAFVAPCTVTYGFVFNNSTTISEGRTGVGCSAIDTINLPILLPANGTATITTSGNATMGVDYSLSTTSLNNTSGNVKQDSLKVFVFNDAVIEDKDSVVINISVTNAGANPSNTRYVINILDDDVMPVIGSDSIVLLNENFDNATTGFNGPTGWVETLEIPEVAGVDPTLPGNNQWGVFNGTLAIAPKLAVSLPNTGGTYNNASTSQTRITPPVIDARGLSNIKIKFDYTIQGEVDPNGADPEKFGKFDYLSVLYSLDGVSYAELGEQYRLASAAPISGTFNATLPAFLNNKQFNIGFRWANDANAGGPVSVTIDNLLLSGSPKKIETTLASLSRETTNSNQEVYFYSQQDGDIIGKMSGSNASYGCVTASIINAGAGTLNLYSDVNGTHKVGQKVTRITPSANNGTGNYTISLYYTQAEINAIQTATNTPPTGFFLYKVNGDFSSASTGNTIRIPVTYTAIPNAGGVFTAAFSNGFSDFALGASVAGALPVTCVDFTGVKASNSIKLNWRVSAEVNNRNFELERSTDGVQYTSVATINAQRVNAGLYSFTDNNVQGLKDVFYRLKQIDLDGSIRYICTTVKVKFDDKNQFTISPIYPNPGKENSFVKITSTERMKINIELVSSVGQLLQNQVQILAPGANIIPLNTKAVSSGNYMVRFRSENGSLLSTQSFIRR